MSQPLLQIKPHLKYIGIKYRYRACKNAVEKTRWNLIRLMAKPKMSITEAAESAGICERWARQIVHRYNKEGAKGLIDKRKNNKGQKPILTKKQQEKLKNTLANKTPPDKGLWTSPKIADWIEKETGNCPNSLVTSWNYLQQLGFTLQHPRPCHIKSATEKEKRGFKKN